ncbi:hypothetical protein L3X38_016531 [Prunus dulcis]|uniref:Uncharacterized protein n=1 Tax=Prunus dulcis TaxID=3755 RepID=A0AAD4W859_PRUDU|nr:hypothetical protein L3X38_016531 [Prunus dulcis]
MAPTTIIVVPLNPPRLPPLTTGVVQTTPLALVIVVVVNGVVHKVIVPNVVPSFNLAPKVSWWSILPLMATTTPLPHGCLIMVLLTMLPLKSPISPVSPHMMASMK